MKKGWTYKKLGEVCCKSSNIKWDMVSCDTSYKYIDLTSVDRDDLAIHNPQIITKENAPSRAKQIVKNGDIIFATTRPTLRRVSLINEMYDGAICSTGFCVLRPQKEILSKWIFYCLQNNGFYNYIEPLQTGASYPAVTDGIVKGYEMLVPSLKEQKQIVERLDAAFAQIDELKTNAEKQLAEARALFQKSLAKAMEPKEGWEEKTLKEITTKIGSGATPLGGRKVYISEGISLVRSMNVHYNSFKYDELAHINAEAADQLSGVELKQNDVLFNITGASIARCCVLPDEVMPARVNQHVAIIRPITESVTPQFLCLCLISSDYQKELLQIGEAGSTRQALTKADLENFKISLPSLSEQQRIVERLDSISENVRKYEDIQLKIIAECDALKQALLRQVFE